MRVESRSEIDESRNVHFGPLRTFRLCETLGDMITYPFAIAPVFALVASSNLAAAEQEEKQDRRVYEAAREQQWLYRERLGSGETEPTAVFLSWNYDSVIFRATCDRQTAELVLSYRLEQRWQLEVQEPLEISSQAGAVRLRTVRRGDTLEGRVTASRLDRIMRSPGELELLAPNEMGEPWYVGRAEPLRRLTAGCRTPPR